MPNSNLKKLVRARMAKTGESYVTALMRVRECRVLPGDDVEARAEESIRQSPPRRGSKSVECLAAEAASGLECGGRPTGTFAEMKAKRGGGA